MFRSYDLHQVLAATLMYASCLTGNISDIHNLLNVLVQIAKRMGSLNPGDADLFDGHTMLKASETPKFFVYCP
jgi:hypothetical protein